MTKIKLNLYDLLVQALGSETTYIPATVDVGELLEFNDIRDCKQDIDDLLDDQKMVATIWTIDDVLQRRPDLTRDQAWNVLSHTRDDFRRDRCHLDFIESTADCLHPRPSGKTALRSLLARIDARISALPDDEATDPAAYGAVAVLIDNFEQEIGPVLNKQR